MINLVYAMAVIGACFCVTLALAGILGLGFYVYVKFLVFGKELKSIQNYARKVEDVAKREEQILEHRYREFCEIVHQVNQNLQHQHACMQCQNSLYSMPPNPLDMDELEFQPPDGIDENGNLIYDDDDDDEGEEWKKGKKNG